MDINIYFFIYMGFYFCVNINMYIYVYAYNDFQDSSLILLDSTTHPETLKVYI
jgi:hypothetical protein